MALGLGSEVRFRHGATIFSLVSAIIQITHQMISEIQDRANAIMVSDPAAPCAESDGASSIVKGYRPSDRFGSSSHAPEACDTANGSLTESGLIVHGESDLPVGNATQSIFGRS